MIIVNQIVLSVQDEETTAFDKARIYLNLQKEEVLKNCIIKKSIDARKKAAIKLIYRIGITVQDEEAVYRRYAQDSRVELREKEPEIQLVLGKKVLPNRPVIVGSGPCGLFCALLLAQQGYRPVVIERGKPVSERLLDVKNFWKTGVLQNNSNVQFGEGGAGTFSDGKLNTLIKDKEGYGRYVLNAFVNCGAPNNILYDRKPHLGSDKLHEIIPRLRKTIESFGGTFLFQTQLTDMVIANQKLSSITVNGEQNLSCEVAVLALGHSARDTFSLLKEKSIPMEVKPFAIGVRIEHRQSSVEKMQYGDYAGHPHLPTADYKLTYRASSGRGVYSFCMCPGGVVVNAASESNSVVTNGMSNYSRDGENANSALVVTVTPEDFDGNDVLSGVEFQRKWEAKAFELAGDYRAPAQRAGDFLSLPDKSPAHEVNPTFPNGVVYCDLHDCLPHFVCHDIEEALQYWRQRFLAFSDMSAVMIGVETRTSSPVRILRNDRGQSSVEGIYPAGEGAGYAGGIMSAAIDGIRTALHIMNEYAPIEEKANE